MTERRPPTKTIRRVLDWLVLEVGLSVYGPVIGEKGQVWSPGNQDYRLEEILLRWKAIQKGIPDEDHDG